MNFTEEIIENCVATQSNITKNQNVSSDLRSKSLFCNNLRKMNEKYFYSCMLHGICLSHRIKFLFFTRMNVEIKTQIR